MTFVPNPSSDQLDQSAKLLAELTIEKEKLEQALEEQILQTLNLQKELDKFKVGLLLSQTFDCSILCP